MQQRWERNGHKGCIVWLTGLSGSGKSTLAKVLESELFSKGLHVFVLDGDNLRHGLSSNLGFAPEDRSENIRRAAEAGILLALAGHIVLIALIAPFSRDRLEARRRAHAAGCEFVEVFVDAPLSLCEQRDPKKLYQKARAGEIAQFTGIDAAYEAPTHPDIHVRTGELTIGDSVSTISNCLLQSLHLKNGEKPIAPAE